MKLKKLIVLGTSIILAVTSLASCGTKSQNSYESKDGKTIYTYRLNMYTADGV